MKKKKSLKFRCVQKQIKSIKKIKKTYHKKQKSVRPYNKKVKLLKQLTTVEPTSSMAVNTEVTSSIKKRGRKSKGGGDKMYFTSDTEKYIIEYNNTDDLKVREDLYNTKFNLHFKNL